MKRIQYLWVMAGVLVVFLQGGVVRADYRVARDEARSTKAEMKIEMGAAVEGKGVRFFYRRSPVFLAQAVQPATCDVVEIQASNQGSDFDPKLDDVKGKLSGLKWTSYKQLARQKMTTPHKKPTSGKLTNGGKVTLLYKDKMSEGKRPRLRFGVDIEDKEGTQIASTTTAFDSGDWILISGEPDDKGVYILAIGCTAK
jgi:hypothetical protein